MNCESCDGRWEGSNTFHTDLGDKMKVFSVLAVEKKGHEENGFHRLLPFVNVFVHFLIVFSF